MAMVKRLKEYLDSNEVPYEVNLHRMAYTSQEIAAISHVSGKSMAKVVILRRGGEFVMAVLPAACKVGLDRFQAILSRQDVALAREQEFAAVFMDCDVGAMPPFGNLYGLEVYVDEELSREPQITFQAGNHHEMATMRYADYARLVKPTVCEFCSHAQLAA